MSNLTQKERDELPESKFADPKNRKFPILDCSDFDDAWGLAGHAEDPEAVRKRILEMGADLSCPLSPAMEEWRESSPAGKAENASERSNVQIPPTPRGTYSAFQRSEGNENRASFQATAEVNSSGLFEIHAMTAGSANGWNFAEQPLRESLMLWDGVECFVDHAGFFEDHRSVRDLGGVCHSPEWDAAAKGVKLQLRTAGPSGPLVESIGRELLRSSPPAPRIGFSADIGFTASGRDVKQILRVFSVDLVFDPARGGAFLRALNSLRSTADYKHLIQRRQPQEATMPANVGTFDKTSNTAASPTAAPQTNPPETGRESREVSGRDPTVLQQLNQDVEAVRTLLTVQQERMRLEEEASKAREVRAQMCAYLLESGLAASKLPKPAQDRVRTQFAGKLFEPTELTAAIEDARKLVADLIGGTAVAGVSGAHNLFSSEDQLTAAVDDLLEAPRDPALASLKTHRLSGIRELYHMLTGDYDLHGGYYPERARLATTSDFSGLVKNALNKIVVNQWERLGRAGYDWWKKIVVVEHFNSLNGITGTLVGTVGTLPAVAEGGEYTELVVGDSPETATFTKYGGYIPLTLELIDRDETRKLKAYPRELASAAIRKISYLVSYIFSQASGLGPTMADGGTLFNATAVTTVGGHANLLTAALAADKWELACQAVYDQPMLIKQAAGYYGTGPKMAINPRYCLVPRVLTLTARAILEPEWNAAATYNTENLQRGQPGDVITVPEWTDATDWAAVCDPDVAPAIFVGERFGIQPEIFIAGDELSPAVFMNDEHRLKVRHFLAVWVNDFRPLNKTVNP
jgi:hypothetical protein